MDIIKSLIARIRHAGVLVLIGFLLIIYIALGFLYLQQGEQQEEMEQQIAKLSLIVARPLPSSEQLQAEYEEVNRALAPVTASAAITILVGIAEESGIDIDEASGKFRVPSATVSQTEMGGGTYKILSFKDIYVQDDYDNVMAFISDLDSGKTLETMVLKRVASNEIEVTFTGEEGDRRAEFRNVVSAVIAMMTDIGLTEIPNPMSFADGVATDNMSSFPDITTTAADRGYSGNITLKNGYVLYNHDKIDPDDTTQFETVSYIDLLITTYYYTCEADGTVRQFDGADVATATEYLGSKATKMETVVHVNVDIYTRLEE